VAPSDPNPCPSNDLLSHRPDAVVAFRFGFRNPGPQPGCDEGTKLAAG
jgi:hypothetical protein